MTALAEGTSALSAAACPPPPTTLAPVGRAVSDGRAWRGSYVRSIIAADAVCALAAGLMGYLVRFGDAPNGPLGSGPLEALLVASCMPFAWVAAMWLARSYEPRYLGLGEEEFRRVLTAAVWVAAAFATVSWATQWDIARGFVVIALPLAGLATLVQRYARRQVLHRQRTRGMYRSRMLVVGQHGGALALRTQIDAAAYQGLDVIGCCVPLGQNRRPADPSLPVLGALHDVVDVVRAHGVDVVAVLPSSELEGPALRRLGWDLEQTDAELLLAPAVTDIAGPRVAIRPVAGLPLLHVERPELSGGRRMAKQAFDVVAAASALVLLSPLLLVIAALVKATSPGPALYRQRRIGKDGHAFTMLKFRSMVTDAEAQLRDLLPESDGNAVLFKMRADPRVTRVGRVLRRYSLDELPQLVNVLRGQMSLVGPRPPLPAETDRYGNDMHRRFLVKPGMTGLWQISGRSDLSWDDSVRIDVRYVEKWSFGLDLFILWKTLGAVRGGNGAY